MLAVSTPDLGLRRPVGPLVSNLMEEEEEAWRSPQGIQLHSSPIWEMPGTPTSTYGGGG